MSDWSTATPCVPFPYRMPYQPLQPVYTRCVHRYFSSSVFDRTWYHASRIARCRQEVRVENPVLIINRSIAASLSPWWDVLFAHRVTAVTRVLSHMVPKLPPLSVSIAVAVVSASFFTGFQFYSHDPLPLSLIICLNHMSHVRCGERRTRGTRTWSSVPCYVTHGPLDSIPRV